MKIKMALAVAAVSGLTLVGCSTDSDSDSAAETSPAATASAEATDEATDEAGEMGTIVDVASGNPDFSTLVAAVQAADLVETLSGEGPFTVFAPTNEAFDALPEGVLDKLLLPENKEVLADILTYHVVAGEITSDQIEPGKVATVEGADITITTDDGGVQVDGATVVTADVMADNGVIHVIDAVILPPDVDPASL